jgi:hypothetical protein
MRRWGLLILLMGCREDDGTTLLSTTGDTGTIPTGSDEASVVLISWLPSAAEPNPELTLQGIFAVSRFGTLNLAQCVLSARSFCVDSLPELPGESIVTTDFDPAILEPLTTRDVGRRIDLGTRRATYLFDPGANVGYYFDQWAETDLGTGPLGLEIVGEAWPPYSGTNDIAVPSEMQLTAPDALEVLSFFDNAPIELTWTVPADVEGDVWLHYDTPVEQRLIRLEDTGAYSLDLRGLGLLEGDTITLTLGRWTRDTVTKSGNQVELLVQSNQTLLGSWRAVRAPLDGQYDECADAQLAPGTPPGNYTGTLIGATGDLDPGPTGCTGFPASGVDRVVPVDLLDQDLLTVTYQLESDDASVYLVTDCTAAETCLVGSDSEGLTQSELLVWFNDTGGPLRVYVVLDAFGEVTDDFNLDLTIEGLASEVLVPTCVDALYQGPIDGGEYHGTIAGNADNLNPACAMYATGGEGMAQIELRPGETMTAVVEAPYGDPKLYLLTNCAIGDSCILYSDLDSDSTEEVVYTNPTPFSQNFYLVLDSTLNLGEYFLDLTIE